MAEAWVVRPKPHGTNRLEEFLNQGIVALGWPDLGDLSRYGKEEIRSRIKEVYGHSSHKLGQETGQIDRFVNEFSEGDLVIVPSGGNVYIGEIESGYNYVEEKAPDEEGYPHQRDVVWKPDGAIDRTALPGKLHDTLKGRLTVFSADYSLVAEVQTEAVIKPGSDPYVDLQENYRERLQAGELRGMVDRNFEEAARLVLSKYYPSITNVAGSVDPKGDTDLLAEGPGDVTIRVQVKHFYTEAGELGAGPVEQLAKSMDEGDSGIVLTSTTIGEEAKTAAQESSHSIGFIDGEEFTELLFENIDDFNAEELNTLGLRSQPPSLL